MYNYLYNPVNKIVDKFCTHFRYVKSYNLSTCGFLLFDITRYVYNFYMPIRYAYFGKKILCISMWIEFYLHKSIAYYNINKKYNEIIIRCTFKFS